MFSTNTSRSVGKLTERVSVNVVVELLPENRSASVGIGEERLISHGKLLFPKYDIIVFIRLGQQVLEYCLQQAILDILDSRYWRGQMELTHCQTNA